MKQSEKAKAMTPEQRKAWNAKMQAARAAKRGESTVVVDKPTPKPKPKPEPKQAAATAAPQVSDDGDSDDWLL